MTATDGRRETARVFGLKMNAVRTQKGMSLTALSEKSGVAPPTLSHIEAGRRNITLHMAERLASGLGVSLVELMSAKCPVVCPRCKGEGYITPDEAGGES